MKFAGICRLIFLSWCVLGCVLQIAVAHAAPHTEVPPTPGAVLGTMTSIARPVLPVSPAQVLLPDQSAPPRHDRNGKRFQVHSFHFVGATAFPEMRLKRVVDRFVDLELNLYDLSLAADAITEFYHDQGYLLAQAIIPAQRVDDGVVTLAVVEGRIGGVLFSGNKSYTSEFLKTRVGDLSSGSLMKTSSLERTLLLLNDLPGLDVRATLSPGAEFGLSDVLIKAEEHRFAGRVTVDNMGREETGRLRTDIGAELNNPLGIGDQLKMQVTSTERKLTSATSLNYSMPIGENGNRLAASYSSMKYDLAGTFAALGIQGSARTFDLTMTSPLTRSRSRNETLTMSARRTHLLQNSLLLDSSSVVVPMLSLGYLTNSIDKDASVSNLLVKMSTNLRRNTYGQSTNAVRYLAEIDGNYLLPLNRYWDFYFRGAGAYSPDRLPDSEKYSIGGPGSVRAYRSSELRGDSGWQSTVEVRRSLPLGPVPTFVSLFSDIGCAIYKAPGFSDAHDMIRGWGVGLTFYPYRQTVIKLEASRAGKDSYQAGDAKSGRVWLNLNTSF